MLHIIHCRISHANGSAIGGTIPKLVESEINNCENSIDNYDELRPDTIGATPLIRFNESLIGDLTVAIMYNIFNDIRGSVIKFSYDLSALDNDLNILHNTFYNSETCLDCSDYRQDYGWPSWDSVASAQKIIFKDNLLYNNANSIKNGITRIEKSFNLINGVQTGSYISDGGGNLEYVTPIFQNEPADNFRLVWEGFDHDGDGIVPFYSSQGAFSASDSSDMGAYHTLDDREIEYYFSKKEVRLQSPAGTEIKLKALHAKTGDGLLVPHSYSKTEYYSHQLDYSDKSNIHDRNRTTHVLKQLRKSKSPIIWYPFDQNNPNREYIEGRKISKNEWEWWRTLNARPYNIADTPTYSLSLSNSSLDLINTPYDSVTSYEKLSGRIFIDPSAPNYIKNLDTTWFVGEYFIIRNQAGSTFYCIYNGRNHEVDTFDVIAKRRETLYSGGDLLDLRPYSAFHVGYITPPQKWSSNPNINILYWLLNYTETGYFEFCLPLANATEQPFGRFDDYVLTILTTPRILQIIKDVQEATWAVPPEPEIPLGYSNSTSNEDGFISAFRLESAGEYSIGMQQPEKTEVYKLHPIFPNNPFNLMDLIRYYLGFGDQTTIISIIQAINLECAWNLPISIESLITETNRQDIKSSSGKKTGTDAFYSNGAELVDHHNQREISKTRDTTYSGQTIELFQTIENRDIRNFENSKYPYLYSPTQPESKWEQLTAPPVTGWIESGIHYHDGFIYIYGGTDLGGSIVSGDIYRYNIATDTWEEYLTLVIGLKNFAYYSDTIGNRAFGNGGTDIIGNLNNFFVSLDYDTNTFVNYTPQPEPRIAHGMVIYDDFIYTYGGRDLTSSKTNIYRYDRSAGTWSELTNMTFPVASFAYEKVNDNPAHFGGVVGFALADKFGIYNVLTDSWIYGNLPTNYRAYNNRAIKYGSKVYIFGGRTLENSPLRTFYTYDETTGNFESIPDETVNPPARHSHMMCVASDLNKIFIVGGVGYREGAQIELNDIWSYDLS